MPLTSLPNLNLPSWQLIAIPAVGLVTALGMWLVGRLVQSRGRAPTAPAAPPADEPADEPVRGKVHDPFDLGSVSEQRQGVRRKGNPIEILVTDAQAEQEPKRGWVVNRAANGLCLLLQEEVAEGTVLSVKPRQAPASMPWVRVEVRNCARDQSGYQTGCQFVSTPPWGILLLFG
jgi:hypothetical protein